MRVKLTRASDWKYEEFREVGTLDEFCALLSDLGETIVSPGSADGDEAAFEVMDYDDYVE